MEKETQILKTNLLGECPVTAIFRVAPLGEGPSELREEIPEPGCLCVRAPPGQRSGLCLGVSKLVKSSPLLF